MEDSIRRALGYPVLYPSSPVPKVHMYVDMAEQKELAKATNVPFNLINPVKVVAYMIDGVNYDDLPNLHFDACKNVLREAQSHSRTTNRTTATKASLRLLQMLHGGHWKINLLFHPSIPAHASGISKTIQEAEKPEISSSLRNRGELYSNFTILRVRPGEMIIQRIDYDSSGRSSPTLKIVDVLSKHPLHHHQERCLYRHYQRPQLILWKSSWHRGQYYYNPSRSRSGKGTRDYSGSAKESNFTAVEGDHVHPFSHIAHGILGQPPRPQVLPAQPLYPTAGAIPTEYYAIQPTAIPQYSQIIPSTQPLPPGPIQPICNPNTIFQI